MQGGGILNALSEIEKGYIFGLFEGDGYKFHDLNCRRFQVEFYLNSKSDLKIIDYVCLILGKIGLNPNLYQDKRFFCKRVRVYSKELFKVINKNINLSECDNQFKLGYVSGIIDSEGYVNNEKSYIMIINTNKNMIEQVSKYLNSEGIKNSYKIRNPSIRMKKDSYKMYVSVKFKSLPHLSIKAGKH